MMYCTELSVCLYVQRHVRYGLLPYCTSRPHAPTYSLMYRCRARESERDPRRAEEKVNNVPPGPVLALPPAM